MNRKQMFRVTNGVQSGWCTAVDPDDIGHVFIINAVLPMMQALYNYIGPIALSPSYPSTGIAPVISGNPNQFSTGPAGFIVVFDDGGAQWFGSLSGWDVS